GNDRNGTQRKTSPVDNRIAAAVPTGKEPPWLTRVKMYRSTLPTRLPARAFLPAGVETNEGRPHGAHSDRLRGLRAARSPYGARTVTVSTATAYGQLVFDVSEPTWLAVQV